MKAAGGGAPATVNRGFVREVVPVAVRVVQDRAQDGRGHAGERDALVLDKLVDLRGVNSAEHDVGRAHRRDREGAAPAVGVEHRQRPQLDVVVAHAQVGDEVVGVDVAVAVGQHHALGPRGRARRVVDRGDVVLVLLDRRRRGRRLRSDQVVPRRPAVRRVDIVAGDDPVLDGPQCRAGSGRRATCTRGRRGRPSRLRG